ncbi:MAG: ABC transporter permease [Chloroflexota bacterium]|nr:ABC transporter permease [Chloroflexota bacterium]
MKKTWIVLKTEFINTITRRSFLLTLILVPLVPALILGGISLFGGDEGGSSIGELFQPSQGDSLPDGYVDFSGIIEQLPPGLDSDFLVEFKNQDAARNAILADEIGGYFLIEKDFLNSGEMKYFREDFNPLTAMETTGIIDSVIRYNLLERDLDQLAIFSQPIQVNRVDLAPDVEERDTSNPLSFYLPYGVSMLFYVIIITSASLLMSSIAKEKENRVMEILMSSVKPIQLFAGKIFALGLVGLLQMVLWLGSGLLMLRLGGRTLNIPPNLQLPAGLLPWGIVFFILGYLVYATIMAGVGAFVPNLKEASQATFYIIAPILIPLMLVGVIIEQPNATLPTILSLIPFTAPTTIMTRMAVSPVPLWQLLVAITLLIVTILLLIRAVAGMFRAQLLLTGKKFNLGSFIKTLLGQEG